MVYDNVKELGNRCTWMTPAPAPHALPAAKHSGSSGGQDHAAEVVGQAGQPGTPELSHNRVMFTLAALRTGNRDEILRLAARRGARNLRVFGSVARGEANVNSDLDLLVDWEPGRSLLDHSGLVQDLQELLGIKVHVGTEKSLHWYVRDRILREATPL